MCLKCESVCAFQERNFSVEFPDLDIVVALPLLGPLDRLLIVSCVNIKTADDVTIFVDVVGV
jgi:hypothetical protein